MDVKLNDVNGMPLNDGDTVEFRKGARMQKTKLKWSESLGVVMLATERGIVTGWLSDIGAENVRRI